MEAVGSVSSSRSRGSQNKSRSWSRRKRTASNVYTKDRQEPEINSVPELVKEQSAKRKANDVSEISPKLSKQFAGLMVHQKLSRTDI